MERIIYYNMHKIMSDFSEQLTLWLMDKKMAMMAYSCKMVTFPKSSHPNLRMRCCMAH